jgi:hypothetical protein
MWQLTARAARAYTRCARESGQESRMKNVEMKIEGNILIIRVDLSKEFGPSSSGKTTIIASTEGNVSIPDREEKVGLNVYRKK